MGFTMPAVAVAASYFGSKAIYKRWNTSSVAADEARVTLDPRLAEVDPGLTLDDTINNDLCSEGRSICCRQSAIKIHGAS